jgi:hypothetical protein
MRTAVTKKTNYLLPTYLVADSPDWWNSVRQPPIKTAVINETTNYLPRGRQSLIGTYFRVYKQPMRTAVTETTNYLPRGK